MLKKLKRLITTLTISGMIFVPLAVMPAVAHAGTAAQNACNGARLTVDTTGTTPCAETGGTINKIITWVLDLFSVIVGIAAVIMIVVGGFKYTISGGDSARVTSAKDTILFAIVGLVVVALAQVIVHFVIHNVQVAGA